MTATEINAHYKTTLSNTANAAMKAATACHAVGGSIEAVTEAARSVLANAGGFGKTLDAQTRRVVASVTSIKLAPGEGHGTVRDDGTISYRG